MYKLFSVISLTGVMSAAAFGQPTSFTYQGQLKQAGLPVNGTVNLEFSLWDADAGGNLVAGPLSRPNTQVTDGLFSVLLDFPPAVFNGARRWLEVTVDGTPMSPRQELTGVPYAIHSTRPWETSGSDISYVDGAVGVGTSTPAHRLDVAGDAKLRERLAVGNDAGFGSNSPYGFADFDVSHVHNDFATSVNWSTYRSYMTFDPGADLAAPSSLYSHDFECITPAANDRAYNYLQGPYLGAFHQGSGNVGLLAGGNFVAQTTGSGSVDYQIGGYVASVLGTGGAGTGTIQRNEGLQVITGNSGAAGATIDNDYSIYVFSPHHTQPITNHYGIYLEDQDFGQNDSFAIYSVGGTNYLGGNLGIGTSAPQAKLHLGGLPGVDGIMFPDGSLQTSAAGLGGGGGGFWSLSGADIFNNNGGNVGIGTTTPQTKLDVRGSLVLDPGGSPTLYTAATGGEQNRFLNLINSTTFQSASGLKAGGILVSDSYGYANPGKNDLVVKGTVGIGTATPGFPLTIRTSNSFFVSGYGWVHTNGTQELGSYVSAGGGWLGTRSNDPLHFFTNDSSPQMTLATSGRLGIGTQTPVCPLHAQSSQTDVSAIFGTAASGTANAGVYGASTASNGNGIIGEAHNGGSAYGVWGRAANGIGGYFEGGAYAIFANGRARVSVLEIAGADVAEKFPCTDESPELGTVMEIDPDHAGHLRVAREAYCPRVAGVVSGAGDLPVGAVLGHLPGNEDAPAIALSGRVWVRCDARRTAIEPGDLLTSSDTPGHAMKAADRERSHGAILGKAMSSLARGERGLVLVLVNLQ
ncbi:MAG: hypothetical protein HY763_13555 [Planctomycetes bacterium]|nr:hypothetical protein [Planctomycetota bacterium]